MIQQCMVIGDPVIHSLSPTLHTAGYAAAGLTQEFTYTARHVTAADLPVFVSGLRSSNVRGLSVTMPHKESIIPLLDSVDEIASRIGAVNTVVHDGELLTGSNTDWIGVVAPLTALTKLKGKSVAVIGAGGAARAFVYGLARAGARVTIYNRTIAKAQALSSEYDCEWGDLSDSTGIRRSDIICNTTVAGQTPLSPQSLASHQIVFDANYHPYDTQLLLDALAAGAQIVHGTEMLLHQGMAQFELFTGHDAPQQAMHKALL